MRFLPGDSCIYHGPTQGNLLAPGDAVEVIEDFNPGYRVRLSSPFVQAYYTCDDTDLSLFLPFSFDTAKSTSIAKSNRLPYPDRELECKEQGLCTHCGTKLDMSSFGLLPCSVCPPPLAKW